MRSPTSAVLLAITLALGALAPGCRSSKGADAALLSRADNFYSAKRYNEAYVLYDRAARKDPKNVDALIGLAECCLWLHDSQRGLHWVNEALALAPDSALAWEKKGELLLSQRDNVEAIPAFLHALSLDGQLNAARLNLSLAYAGEGQIEKAVKTSADAVALQPKSADARLKHGITLELAGKTAEAEAEYQRAVNLDPNNPAAMLRLANLLVSKKEDLTQARSLAQRADRLDPGQGDAAVLAAWALFLTGDKKSALAELEQVVNAHPSSFQAWTRFAAALKATGHAEGARRARQMAASLAPRPAVLMEATPKAGATKKKSAGG